jgi:hypothetical protein
MFKPLPMPQKRKIGFFTKYLSNRHYVSEVSVDGKKNIKFNFKWAFYDRYVSQIIRTGNCIALYDAPLYQDR